MVNKLKNWFLSLSVTGKTTVIAVALALITSGVSASTAQTTPQAQKPVEQHTACVAMVSETTETKTVDFDTKTIEDPNIASGEIHVVTPGKNGQKTITYKLTKYNPSGCNNDSKVLINSKTVSEPVTQITSVGTYVAPEPVCDNGSYVNSDGNIVCNPSSNPNGATAQCADGTYSYSQHRSGTCSHHGGVSVWY